jgi:outer membrane protein assembly factor BamB
VYVITEEDVVEARSRADGSILWRYQREREEGFLVAGHSGLSLTPNNRLLAGFGDGMVTCLDALDGRVKWERDTSLDVPEAEPGRPRYTDVDTTPVLLGEQVYAASFGAGLYALDANNGSVIWRDSDWTGVTSMLGTEDGALLLVSADRGIARYDVTQRNVSWIKSLERGSFGVPEAFDGMVVVGDSRGSLVALALADGTEVGRIEAGHGFVARTAVAGNRGFIVTNGGVLLSMRLTAPVAR